MSFEFKTLDIPDAILIKPKVFEDERGFFMESYKKEEFEKAGIKGEFVQDNHSRSKHSILRGLHFQKEPYAQAKVIRCVRGVVYDVAVDLRRKSQNFGEYVDVILSEYNRHLLYVPRGFAHGFLVLSGVAEVIYKVDNLYAPEYERGLIWNDPDVNISWPDDDPVLSQRDMGWQGLKKLLEMGETF